MRKKVLIGTLLLVVILISGGKIFSIRNSIDKTFKGDFIDTKGSKHIIQLDIDAKISNRDFTRNNLNIVWDDKKIEAYLMLNNKGESIEGSIIITDNVNGDDELIGKIVFLTNHKVNVVLYNYDAEFVLEEI